MRKTLMSIVAALIFAAFVPAVEKNGSLAGTWVFDPAHSDSGGQTRRTSRIGGLGGGLGGILGIPGMGYPRTGYPGGRSGGGYPNGRDGDDGGGNGGDFPRSEVQNLTLEIVQTENEIDATRKFTMNGEEKTVNQKFLLDGSENTNPASNGRGEFVCRSTWKNDKLVNSGTQNVSMRGQNYDMSVKEEYSVSKDGKVLTIKTTRTTPRGDTSLKQLFNRQETPSESSSSSKSD